MTSLFLIFVKCVQLRSHYLGFPVSSILTLMVSELRAHTFPFPHISFCFTGIAYIVIGFTPTPPCKDSVYSDHVFLLSPLSSPSHSSPRQANAWALATGNKSYCSELTGKWDCHEISTLCTSVLPSVKWKYAYCPLTYQARAIGKGYCYCCYFICSSPITLKGGGSQCQLFWVIWVNSRGCPSSESEFCSQHPHGDSLHHSQLLPYRIWRPRLASKGTAWTCHTHI